MNWTNFVVIAVLNTFLCLMQLVAEKIDKKTGKIAPRHSLIPGTKQKFLYWEDFYTQIYGDLLGLVWIINGFYSMVPILTNYELLAFGPLSVVSYIIFIVPRLSKDHKPSWGEPEIGKISLGGHVHSFYFSLTLAMAITCVYGMITGKMTGIIFWTTLTGGLVWTISCIADILTGNFSALEKR